MATRSPTRILGVRARAARGQRSQLPCGGNIPGARARRPGAPAASVVRRCAARVAAARLQRSAAPAASVARRCASPRRRLPPWPRTARDPSSQGPCGVASWVPGSGDRVRPAATVARRSAAPRRRRLALDRGRHGVKVAGSVRGNLMGAWLRRPGASCGDRGSELRSPGRRRAPGRGRRGVQGRPAPDSEYAMRRPWLRVGQPASAARTWP